MVWQQIEQAWSRTVRHTPFAKLDGGQLLGLGVACAAALALGAGLSTIEVNRDAETVSRERQDSETLALLGDAPETRQQSLVAIAEGKPSLDRNRARYLLAIEAIDNRQPEVAIEYLSDFGDGLLGDWALWQLARAQGQLEEFDAQRQTLKELLERYGDRPVAAEALYELGNGETSDSEAWQLLFERFPTHERAAFAATTQIAAIGEKKPAALPALRILIQHHYRSDITDWLDLAVESHKDQLTPEDWQHIAFGYWEELNYRKAGPAYAQAPSTAQNRYRQARSLQLAGKKEDAAAAYKNAIAAFPKAPETALSLRRLASLLPEEQALPLLERAMAEFPDSAAESLYDRALVLEKLGSKTSAQNAKKSILTQYGDSETAAELRWSNANRAAKAGDARTAIDWAQQIVESNPDSDLAPEAGFWLGKWRAKVRDFDGAERAFRNVISRYPWSYYAWRSAAMLGWDVGNFTTVRDRVSQIEMPDRERSLPAGSDTLKELYALNLIKDAWSQWQVEFTTVQAPSFDEQHTDGILRTAEGDYLDGMFMLTSLDRFDEPENREKYLALRDSEEYWLTLFPFPYRGIVTLASERRGLDPLFSIALIRQESRFVRDIRSVADAVGLMQVLPSTAEWIAAEKGEEPPVDLADPTDNVRLGTLYLQYVHEQWDNNSMLAVASYNAGPGNVEEWLDRFDLSDPDEFVRQIPFDETRGYVSSVFGNYWNYMRLYDPRVRSMLDSL